MRAVEVEGLESISDRNISSCSISHSSRVSHIRGVTVLWWLTRFGGAFVVLNSHRFDLILEIVH